jgi:DUF4097 and DUF4098 domain-containing protein YvlB
VTPSGSKKRNRVTDNSKGKQPKTNKGKWLLAEVAKMVEMNERTTVSCESIAKSINDKVKGVHFIASSIFTKKAEREMFMTIDTREDRFQWLSKKYEWMSSHLRS